MPPLVPSDRHVFRKILKHVVKASFKSILPLFIGADCFRQIALACLHQSYDRSQAKITYLKLVFTKVKAAERCSHNCLALTRSAVVMCLQNCKTVANVAARQSCEPYEHPYGSWRSCGGRAIKCKLITRLSRGSLSAFNYYVIICGRNTWVRALALVVRFTAALHLLRQSCVLIRSQENRMENEHVENLVFVVAEAVRPKVSQHSLEVLHTTP